MARSIHYEDFSLQVAPDHRGGLVVRVLDAPYGAPEATLKLGYSPAELDTFLRVLEQRVRGRDLRTKPGAATEPEMAPSDVGKILFEALFPGPVRNAFLQSLGWAESRPDTALRLRLKLDPSLPELAAVRNLPWELVYRAETRDFLSRCLMPVMRHLEGQRLKVREDPKPPLRVLVVVSSPRGVAFLDLEKERERIESAWGRQSDVQIEFMKQPSVKKVRDALRDEPFHILHFMGHGTFDQKPGEGALLFETPTGEQDPVTGQVLAETLKGSRALRLVFLNACDTAQLPRFGGQDPYTGAASALVMGGIPAVLAMQFSISDEAAIRFSDAFYSALAAGDLIETAVTEGRLAVFQDDPSSWEWVTPVLFMSLKEGRILPPPERPPPPKPPGYYSLGLRSLEKKRYDEALQFFKKAAAEKTGAEDIDYLIALSMLAGKRPRKLSLPAIREIEKYIRYAIAEDERPHHLLFWAFLRYDFYALNRVSAGAPTYENLLNRAIASHPEPAEVEKLLRHLPNPVNHQIYKRIASLAKTP